MPILVGTQILNAVLLIPLLIVMIGMGRDRHLMGSFTMGRAAAVGYILTTALVLLCVIFLAISLLAG